MWGTEDVGANRVIVLIRGDLITGYQGRYSGSKESQTVT
jgi:hypothetical protein